MRTTWREVTWDPVRRDAAVAECSRNEPQNHSGSWVLFSLRTIFEIRFEDLADRLPGSRILMSDSISFCVLGVKISWKRGTWEKSVLLGSIRMAQAFVSWGREGATVVNRGRLFRQFGLQEEQGMRTERFMSCLDVVTIACHKC